MTSFFDGMAGLLNSVFGGSVAHTPPDGNPSILDGVFRQEPIEVPGEDGRDVLIMAPTLKVPADHVQGIVRGSRIEPGNGKAYEVLNSQALGSPASDGFVLFELQEV